MFDIETYDYDLPAHLIAQHPAPQRDKSRLLVVERASGHLQDRLFCDLPDLLNPADLLVVNDTRVVPVRLNATKELTGGKVELLVLEGVREGEEDTFTSWCLYKASKPARKGMRLRIEGGTRAEVVEVGQNGFVRVHFQGDEPVRDIVSKWGHVPLPPYIRRGRESDVEGLDRTRYQTVFSKKDGAVAAPTAGLHFTEELLENLRLRGIQIAAVTLHVGYGTFQPVRTRDIRKHRLAPEYYGIPQGTSEAIQRCKERGGRVVAVGTTVVRALESARSEGGYVAAKKGKTDLLITPGFEFKVIDALVTNFHLPRSSLLFLVAAFAGLELTKRAYAHAVKEQYRFYSYGDAMFIV